MKNSYKEQAANGKRWCYDCIHYRQEPYFCGYSACGCEIYGSLDVDQHERHPDRTADTCPKYFQGTGNRWYEQSKTPPTPDYSRYEHIIGVTKPIDTIKGGDYFKFDDAIWQVIGVTSLRSIKARMVCDFNPTKREEWEADIQCIPHNQCSFIDI